MGVQTGPQLNLGAWPGAVAKQWGRPRWEKARGRRREDRSSRLKLGWTCPSLERAVERGRVYPARQLQLEARVEAGWRRAREELASLTLLSSRHPARPQPHDAGTPPNPSSTPFTNHRAHPTERHRAPLLDRSSNISKPVSNPAGAPRALRPGHHASSHPCSAYEIWDPTACGEGAVGECGEHEKGASGRAGEEGESIGA